MGPSASYLFLFFLVGQTYMNIKGAPCPWHFSLSRDDPRRRSVAHKPAPSSGILANIAAIAVITGLAGRMMGVVGRWSNYFV